MIEIFFLVVFMVPIFALLIWTYLYPEESMLMGKRWMYKEEPEFSKEALRYTKFSEMAIMIGLPIILLSFLTDVHVLKFSLVLLPFVLIVGALRIFGK